ncbi:MAG: hypothetical protein AB7N76_21945 [Planctomycetota bacterium]
MSWKPHAEALLRGGIRAVALDEQRIRAALDRLRQYPDLVEEQAVPTLQGHLGLESPPRRVNAGGVDGRATKAWESLRASDQEELSALVLELSAAEGEVAQRDALARLARKMPGALLRDEGLRRALSGGADGSDPDRGGDVGSKRWLGVAALCFVGALVGRAATQPRIDVDPPELRAQVREGSAVQGKVVHVEGRLVEEDLVTLTVAGRPVTPRPEGRPGSYVFDAEVTLGAMGPQEVPVEAVDGGGRKTTLTLHVERQPFPIEIVLSEPRAAVRGGPTRVAGQVRAEVEVSAVTVGGERLPLDSDGSFHGQVQLPEHTAKATLRLEAHGPEARGALDVEVLVDRDVPQLAVQPHEALTWGAVHEVPLRVVDASPWATVEVLAGGKAAPRRVVTGRVERLDVEVAPGTHTLELAATDPAGNRGAVVRVEVTRKEPSPHLARFARKGEPSTFELDEDLVIAAGDALVIPPGATLVVGQGRTVRVRGRLLAPGTESQPITIKGARWRGIVLEGALASATLRHTTVEGSVSNESGGALSLAHGGRLVVDHCTFADNNSAAHGGAIALLGTRDAPAQAELAHTTFRGNFAGRSGGAVAVGGGARAALTGCVFERNTAQDRGGGLLVGGWALPAEATVERCRFVLGGAGSGGGVAAAGNGRLELREAHVESNRARRYGGGVHASGTQREPARVEVSGGRFLHNEAATSGGGLMVHEFASGALKGAVFEDNRCQSFGGGVLIVGNQAAPGELTLEDVQFVGNRAADGGGLNANFFSRVRARSCVFLRNVASGWGGGVCGVGHSRGASLLALVGCSFKDNSTKQPYHGEDVRVAANVAFDPADLIGSRVPVERASLAAGVAAPARGAQGASAQPAAGQGARPAAGQPGKPVPAAVRPERAAEPTPAREEVPPPPAVEGLVAKVDDDYGRALAHFVHAAARKDYSALRDRSQSGSQSSNSQSWTSKVELPGAEGARIWDARGRHYATVTLRNTVPAEEARDAFDQAAARLRTHLAPGWHESTHERPGGARITVWTLPKPHVVIRLSLTVYKLKDGARASVLLFFN